MMQQIEGQEACPYSHEGGWCPECDTVEYAQRYPLGMAQYARILREQREHYRTRAEDAEAQLAS